MKRPRLKHCPCCGVRLIRFVTVWPECLKKIGNTENVKRFMLFWRCYACGYCWADGMHEGKAQ